MIRSRPEIEEIVTGPSDFARISSPALSNPGPLTDDQTKTRLTIISASDLLTRDFPPPRWIIPGILPEGTTLLAGKPKKGKSFLALGLAVATATAGLALNKIQVEGGDVLYLALEDNLRRIKDRLTAMGITSVVGAHSLDIATQCPRFTEKDGGLEEIGKWAEAHANARYVIVDTLAKIRPPRTRGASTYDEDYAAVGSIKDASDRCGISALVVHHLRKSESEDPMDNISGTLGLTGAADSVIVLDRKAGLADAELTITGRDVEEQLLAIKWNRDGAQWQLLGDAAEHYVSEERAAIRDLLRMNGDWMTIKQVAEVLKKPQNTIKQLLFKMAHDGQVARDGKGGYQLPDNLDNPGNHIPIDI